MPKTNTIKIEKSGFFWRSYDWYIKFRGLEGKQESRCGFREAAWFKAPYHMIFHLPIVKFGNLSLRPISFLWFLLSILLGVFVEAIFKSLLAGTLTAMHFMLGTLIAPLIVLPEKTVEEQDNAKGLLIFGPSVLGLLVFIVPAAILLYGVKFLVEKPKVLKPVIRLVKWFFKFLSIKVGPIFVWQLLCLVFILVAIYLNQPVFVDLGTRIADQLYPGLIGITIGLLILPAVILSLKLTKSGAKLINKMGHWIEIKSFDKKPTLVSIACGWLYDTYRGICPHVEFVPPQRNKK